MYSAWKSQNLPKRLEVQHHKDRTPGNIAFLRGLGRLFEMLATQAILSGYATEHQGLPPKITLCYTAGNLRGGYEWMSGDADIHS